MKWIVNLKKIRMPRAYYPGKPDNQCRWMMRETRNVLRSLLLMTHASGEGEMALLIREAVCDALKLYLFWDGSLELFSQEFVNQIIADPTEQIQLMDCTERKQTLLDDIDGIMALCRRPKRRRRRKG